MTKDKAIAELVRIWHSPHLDLSLKAGLAEVIDALKEKNQSDSLVTDSSDDCKESESKLDLIRRQDALCILKKKMIDRPLDSDRWVIRDIAVEIKLLPSEEPKTGEWIQKDMYADRFCSECNYAVWDSETEEYNFCPNCGSWMKGGDDE